MRKSSMYAIVVSLFIAACSPTTSDTTAAATVSTAPPPTSTTAAPTTTTTSTTAAATTTAAPQPIDVARIKVRTVDGVGQFYNTRSDETFVPRGTNYLDFREVAGLGIADSVFAVGLYDGARVREAFSTLAGLGYNTVRIFYDICSDGPRCLVGADGGWQPEYVDNMADLLRIAAEEGIYVLLTANSIPVSSKWQTTYDTIFGGEMNGLIQNLNGYWLHEAGITAREEMFEDLLRELSARDAQFDAILGWQLQNELWLDPNREPLNLAEGVVDAVAGSYNIADPAARRAMVADSLVLFVDRMRAVLDRYDPEALVTVGFFSPAVANDWAYVDTASIIDVAAVDFWDFHAYHDTYETLLDQADAFGMVGYDAKPIVLGETAGGKAIIPTALANLNAAHDWMAEACALGFDGWLNWGYYPWPANLGGPAWTLLDDDGLLLEWVAPSNQPDMCIPPAGAPTDLARTATITASQSFEGEPATAVIDGSSRSWNAGDSPPQWIELAFDTPVDIATIGLSVEQWPPGQTRHLVTATFANGSQTQVDELAGFTEPEAVLFVQLPEPLREVVSLRIETVESPAWVAWKEISVVGANS